MQRVEETVVAGNPDAVCVEQHRVTRRSIAALMISTISGCNVGSPPESISTSIFPPSRSMEASACAGCAAGGRIGRPAACADPWCGANDQGTLAP